MLLALSDLVLNVVGHLDLGRIRIGDVPQLWRSATYGVARMTATDSGAASNLALDRCSASCR